MAGFSSISWNWRSKSSRSARGPSVLGDAAERLVVGQAVVEPGDLLEPGVHERAAVRRARRSNRNCERQIDPRPALQLRRTPPVQPSRRPCRARRPDAVPAAARRAIPAASRTRPAPVGERSRPIRIALLVEHRLRLDSARRRPARREARRPTSTGMLFSRGLDGATIMCSSGPPGSAPRRARTATPRPPGARGRRTSRRTPWAAAAAASSRHVAADALDRLGRLGPADDHLRRLADELGVQLRQHDDVELQPLRLVDRHHADVGRRGVLRPAAARTSSTKSSARVVASRLVAVGQLDQLHQPVQVAGVALRGEPRGPAVERRPVAVVDQPAADLGRQPPGGRRVVVIARAPAARPAANGPRGTAPPCRPDDRPASAATATTRTAGESVSGLPPSSLAATPRLRSS